MISPRNLDVMVDPGLNVYVSLAVAFRAISPNLYVMLLPPDDSKEFTLVLLQLENRINREEISVSFILRLHLVDNELTRVKLAVILMQTISVLIVIGDFRSFR